MIKGENFASSSHNPFAGCLSESECADVHLGNVDEANVIGNSAHDNEGSRLIFMRIKLLGKAADADGVPSFTSLLESSQDSLVEAGFSPPRKEGVKLINIPSWYLD